MRVLSLGEMMVEFSGAGTDLWRSGFAGDTFNMAWYLAALRPDWQVSYGTRLGTDPLSDAAVAKVASGGIGSDWITRDPVRSIGLYLIALQDGERSFSYWRGQSAARLMAEDEGWLNAAFDAADVVYLSGITMAILDPAGRRRVLDALSGRRVVFDPNIRPRLWEDAATLRATMTDTAAVSEICLPSFDDEAAAFGDASPEATAERYANAGAREVVVKNGPGQLAVASAEGPTHAPAPRAVKATDTTGAGDSFNAGYLAARLGGASITEAIRMGQAVSAEVVCHPGALIPAEALEGLKRRV